MKRVIGYYRVSTAKQGESGLGLEAQQSAVASFVTAQGGAIAKGYIEVESGKRSDRPKLAEALAHAKCIGATLVVAKLDRLSRNVAFLSSLMESGVDFTACDNPHANRLTIHILAAVAEDEAKRISDRTKAALAAYKARGGRLGASLEQCRNLSNDARTKGAKAGGEAVKAKATEAYRHLYPIVTAMRSEGFTLQAIADRLTEDGYTTRRGKAWNHVQVRAVLERASQAV
jgi:DNA invertase Pin-like site-specific DNA recombinase